MCTRNISLYFFLTFNLAHGILKTVKSNLMFFVFKKKIFGFLHTCHWIHANSEKKFLKNKFRTKKKHFCSSTLDTVFWKKVITAFLWPISYIRAVLTQTIQIILVFINAYHLIRNCRYNHDFLVGRLIKIKAF